MDPFIIYFLIDWNPRTEGLRLQSFEYGISSEILEFFPRSRIKFQMKVSGLWIL